MAISMLKIRRPLGRLIFNMGIAIPGKTVFLIETAPRILQSGNETNDTPMALYCFILKVQYNNLFLNNLIKLQVQCILLT